MRPNSILDLTNNFDFIRDTMWDVIIVGSGIGGAVAANSITQKGYKVLVIEAGPLNGESPSYREGLWRSTIKDIETKRNIHPFLGEGVGGSSRLYGMVMERLHEQDFITAGGAWPDSLSEWTPYYNLAEKMFQVQPAPEIPSFEPLYKHFQQKGLKLRHLHLAFQNKKDCRYCQSEFCIRACKVDAWTGPLQEALKSKLAYILPNTKVKMLNIKNKKVRGVLVESKEINVELSANHFILAAGALQTPLLLRRSNELNFSESKVIGHNLMRHLIDLYPMTWPEWKDLPKENKQLLSIAKTWGVDSFYIHQGEKLGTVQSFGRLPPFPYIWQELIDEHPWMKWIPGCKQIVNTFTQSFFQYPVAASIVEDSPSSRNFVKETNDRKIILQYKVSEVDGKKVQKMRDLIHHSFKPLIVRHLPATQQNARLAHACGTCKMGQDERFSCTDRYGRVHGYENLFIADASVFPSSGGVNPSLTIAAHSLRMSEKMFPNSVCAEREYHRGQKSPSE